MSAFECYGVVRGCIYCALIILHLNAFWQQIWSMCARQESEFDSEYNNVADDGEEEEEETF